jgi:alpha-1,3-mannosyltransferase
MKPANDNLLKRLPTWLSLSIGVVLGLVFSKVLFSSVSSAVLSSSRLDPLIQPAKSPLTWRGHHSTVYQSPHLASSRTISMPTIEQRFRVLELLTTLSQHHTRECTRHSNPLYAQQARDRYASLIGHNEPPPSSWLSNIGLGLGGLDGDQLPPPYHSGDDHKYFFAINLYNSFDVIPDLFSTLFRVSSILGFNNVFVSIYENGSSDQTKALLRIFDALCRSVGLRVTIRTSMRTRGNFNHRIEYLAEVRNAAFGPLHELRDAHNEYFDTIVFMNDVLPCVDDLLELIWQSRHNNAGITCAADYMYHDDLVCANSFRSEI